MERKDVLQWLERHPDVLRGDAAEIMSRCERAVRRHAAEDAWLAAKRYVERRKHEWDDSRGAHAGEAYVANELCHQLAHELRHHEPLFEPDDAEHLAGGPVKDELEPEGWEFLTKWILDVARDQEHQTWGEIVHFTNRRGKELAKEKHLSRDSSFDETRCYSEIARDVAAMLEHDFAVQAFPR